MSSVPLTETDVLRTGRVGPVDAAEPWLGQTSSIVRVFPSLAVACALALDCTVVLASFLLAHWARFVVPDDGASALGLENYTKMGLFVSLGTIFIFAVHHFYDFEQPRRWTARIQLIVSAVST